MDPTGFSPSSGPWKNCLRKPAYQIVFGDSGQEATKTWVQILTATFKLVLFQTLNRRCLIVKKEDKACPRELLDELH